MLLHILHVADNCIAIALIHAHYSVQTESHASRITRQPLLSTHQTPYDELHSKEGSDGEYLHTDVQEHNCLCQSRRRREGGGRLRGGGKENKEGRRREEGEEGRKKEKREGRRRRGKEGGGGR